MRGGATANPFPGPRPFAESDSLLFFGRDRELSDLVALLFAHRAVLLHAPSGAGKSSLVNAGLIPRARRRGFEFLPVARVRGTAPNDDEQVGNRYVNNVIENWRAAGLTLPSGATRLSEALTALPPASEPGRVVVFDQIEELFVLHPDRWRDRGDFFSQVQEALDDDALLHFVFVLRDDYLAWLQPLTPRLRDRLNTRYHLRGLSSAQALDAVVRPVAASGRAFAPGVAEEFVRALREQPATSPAGPSYEGEDVEPVQLQIVCRTFFERLPGDVTEIGAEHVARYADVQQALVGFYEQALVAAVRGHPRVHERTVRLWFERQLITPARTRGIVFRGERTTAGLPNPVVDELERRRVVRSEPRGPALWYELTHDRLIDAVLGSNRVWYAKRSRSITRRAAAAVAAFGLLAAVLVVVVVRSQNSGSGASGAEPRKSQISTPGQTVDFHIRGRGGQLLTAIMNPDEGFVGELRLFDAQGVAIGQPSAAQSSQPLLTLPLPADGDYRVEARGRGNSTGSFLLNLAVQNAAAPTELTGPDAIPGSFTAPDQVNVYTFDGRAGAVAEITMTWSGNLDAHLVLIGPNHQGFNEVNGTQGVLTAVLPTDGRYELHAWSLGTIRGPYLLQLQLPDHPSVQPGKVSGALSEQNKTDVRTVRSEVGGALTVSYKPRHGLPDNVVLLAADGRTLVADSGQGGFRWVIAPATPYLLVVYGNDFSTGTSYSLSLGIQEPLPLAGAPARADGQLSRAGQVQVYRQDSEQGDVASIQVRPVGQFDPVVTIVQPDGTTLTKQDDHGPAQDELFDVTLKQHGLHQIVISSSDTSKTGGFHIAVTQRKAAPPSP